jgi:hypothetical protein
LTKDSRSVQIKLVKLLDVIFLLNLLKDRDPLENISHKKVPSLREHIQFVISEPYKLWYVIKIGRFKAGSIYLTKSNEIGIHILKKYIGLGIEKKALDQLLFEDKGKEYFFNVNPKNEARICFLNSIGTIHIQNTYRLEK